MLFGALPALKHAAQHGAPLGGAARGASASRERQRTRNSLVVVQVALALVLLVGSGLMIRTFQALLNVEPGFTTTGDLQTARVWVPPQQVPDPERVTRMQHEILDKIAALPGVTAAAFASAVPMEGPLRVWTQTIYVDGQSYAPGTMPPMRRMKTVSPGYFDAIGTRMIAGRDITWNDIYGRAKVAIVSENFAREVWGSPAAALGQRIRESPRGACLARDHRRRRGRPRGCGASARTGDGLLAGHDGELQRRAAVRHAASQSGHPKRPGGPREPAWRCPECGVVGQLEHARVPRPDDEGSL